jgi:signal transduction histidine kinase
MGIYDNLTTAKTRTEPHRQPVLLIVDDEPGPRESLRMVFKDRYQCVLANCGREGLAYARAHHVDAAVLDIRMPDLSGVEVLRELKQLDPHIECVMLTGYETIETARAAVHYGAADYLNKPFDVFALRDVLAKCIARRQQQAATEDSVASLRALNEDLLRDIANYERVAAANVMSAGVVHELNSPLAIVSAYAQMLGRDLDSLRNGGTVAVEEMQQRVAKIRRELDRCKDVTQRFLQLARTAPQQTERLDIGRLLEDGAALIKAHPDAGRTEIIVEPPSPPLAVNGEPGILLQVLLNLGINALQAMHGNGTLRFDAGMADVPAQCAFRAATLQPAKPHVCLRVADTGPGITPAVLEKIFTPYFTTKDRGNGLGLAILTDLVGRHSGAVVVESQPGTGTIFKVYLPAVD